MNIRGKEVYVSSKTRRRLFWILQLPQKEAVEVRNMPTTDELADRLLNEIIEQKYPNIKALEKRLSALESQLVSELLSPSTSADTHSDD